MIFKVLILPIFCKDMYCRSRRLVNQTQTTKEYVADFIYESLDVTTINNYQVIKDHFANFKIDREYENFLNDQANHSISYLFFRLKNINDEENFIHMFSITIEEHPVAETDYTYNFREDDIDFFNDILSNNTNLENFYINIVMETKFYLGLFFGIVEENEEEENLGTVPVEDIFTEDNCLVCLENKPTILYSSCNHLVVCNECEANGKFKYCVKCREQCFRKIRIIKEKDKLDKCVGDDKKKYVDKAVGDENIKKKYEDIDTIILIDKVKEKRNVVDYLKEKLEKEEKKLDDLECDLEEDILRKEREE